MRRFLIACLALLPSFVAAQGEIRVVSTAAAVGADPDHAVWEAAPASVVTLETAFPGHPSISGTALTQGVEVRALSTPTGLAVRLEWADPTADVRKTQHRFADGAGIQFARDGKADTTPYMGGAGRHVNIWYWNAAKNEAENLWADGFGTLTRLQTQDVTARSRHADGKWRVAFFRAWRSKEARAANLQGKARRAEELRGAQPVAFAVWNGTNDERDGFKAVTMQWQMLRWVK